MATKPLATSAPKKYIVRAGFVVHLETKKADGSVSVRTYDGGEELSLDDGQAAQHQHKLEFASEKDRDAALATEQAAMVASKALQSPVELVSALIAALSQSQAAAGVAPAPAA